MWLTVSKLWEFTVRASYIIFLFIKTENNNFINEIKHVVRASIACWKSRQTNSPKHSPQFSPGFEGTENMFYFLNGYYAFVLYFYAFVLYFV